MILYAIDIVNTSAKWESGKSQPQAARLVALAEIFGCSVEGLLGLGNKKAAGGVFVVTDLAGIGLIIYFVLMVVMRIPELLVLFLGLVVLLVGLALVEVVGKAVWRFVFRGKKMEVFK